MNGKQNAARALLAAALATSAAGALAQSDEPPRLSAGSWGAVHPPVLNGAEIEVFADDKSGSQGGGRQVFFPPVFLPQWDAFGKAVEAACAASRGDEIRSVPLRTEFVTPRLREEVLKEVNDVESTDYAPQQLRIYPYYAIVVTTHPDGLGSWTDSTIRWTYPSGARTLDSALASRMKRTLDYYVGNGAGPLTVTLEDSCAELAAIAQKHNVKAWILTQRVGGVSTTYNASVDFSSIVSTLLDLNRKEAQDGVVRVFSTLSGKSSGLSIPGLGGTGDTDQNSSATKENTVRRFVTMNLIQDAVRRQATRVSISVKTEKGAAAPDPSIVEKLLKHVADQLAVNAHEVTFDPVGTRQYKIKGDQIERTLSEGETTQLLQTAPKSEFAATGEATLSYDDVKASVNTTVKDPRQDSITWKHEGNDWVPKSATLYLIDANALASSTSFAFQQLNLQVEDSPSPMELSTPVGVEPTEHVADLIDQKVSDVERLGIKAPPKQVIGSPVGLVKLQAIRKKSGQPVKVLACADNIPDIPAGYETIGRAETSKPFYRPAGDLARIAALVNMPGYVDATSCIQKKKSNFMSYCDQADTQCNAVYWAVGCHVNSEWLTWYRNKQRLAGLPPSELEMCYAPPAADAAAAPDVKGTATN